MKLNMYIKTSDEPLFARLRTEAEVRGLSLSTALAEAARLWLKEPDPVADLTQRVECIESRLDTRRGGPHLLA